MAKGYLANKERQEALNAFVKEIGKRAGFKCEWHGSLHRELRNQASCRFSVTLPLNREMPLFSSNIRNLSREMITAFTSITYTKILQFATQPADAQVDFSSLTTSWFARKF